MRPFLFLRLVEKGRRKTSINFPNQGRALRITTRNTAAHLSPTAQLLNFRDKRSASKTSHEKVLDVWQGGSCRLPRGHLRFATVRRDSSVRKSRWGHRDPPYDQILKPLAIWYDSAVVNLHNVAGSGNVNTTSRGRWTFWRACFRAGLRRRRVCPSGGREFRRGSASGVGRGRRSRC